MLRCPRVGRPTVSSAPQVMRTPGMSVRARPFTSHKVVGGVIPCCLRKLRTGRYLANLHILVTSSVKCRRRLAPTVRHRTFSMWHREIHRVNGGGGAGAGPGEDGRI